MTSNRAVVLFLVSALLTAAPVATARAQVSALSLVPKEDAVNPVPLEPELEAFFGNICQLPKTLRKVLEKRKKKGFIPADLRRVLEKDLGKSIEKISATGARAVLHSAYFVENGKQQPLRVVGAATYRDLDVMRLVDSGNLDNVAYMLDCSGYLNASIQAGGSIGKGEIQSAAEDALKTQNAAVLVRGAVFSPVAAAINPTPRLLSDVERVDVLFGLVSEVLRVKRAAADDTKIGSWREIALLWTSNQGSSSLQGKASFSASGGISAGIFAMSGDVEAGGSYARSIQFSKFDTYILDAAVIAAGDPTELKGIRANLLELVRGAPRRLDRSNESYEVSVDLPANVCGLTWEAIRSSDEKVFAPTVAREWAGQKCTLKLTPSKDAFTARTAFRLRARSEVAGKDGFVLAVTP